MVVSLVLTVIGPDRPGLVEALSQTLAAHEANWLESRMSRLAGKFAGILHASVPESNLDALVNDLHDLGSQGLRVVMEQSSPQERDPASRSFRLDLVGADHAGIIRDVSRALASRGINVDELSTECTSAPMSGEMLFRATAQLRLPSSLSVEELRENLEELANDLMVDITLDAPPGAPGH